ncbi:MAG TPA: hypothetical protein PKK10_10985 [Woeseiaceae bacterium]|nr:hypothetical protein [Woeseiaceae bacterium]
MKAILLLACLTLAACSGARDEGKDTIGKEIADDYQGAMDDAANVEQQIQQSKDDIDAALKKAEGED